MPAFAPVGFRPAPGREPPHVRKANSSCRGRFLRRPARSLVWDDLAERRAGIGLDLALKFSCQVLCCGPERVSEVRQAARHGQVLRFASLDDLALDVVGKAIASESVDDFIARCEAARACMPRRRIKRSAKSKRTASSTQRARAK